MVDGAALSDIGLLGAGWLDALNGAMAGVRVPEAADGVAQFTVSGAPGGRPMAFHVTVANGEVSVAAGRRRDAEALLSWKYADFLAVWSGELSVEAAYMTGRVKVEGDRILLIDGWRPLRSSSQVKRVLASLGDASR